MTCTLARILTLPATAARALETLPANHGMGGRPERTRLVKHGEARVPLVSFSAPPVGLEGGEPQQKRLRVPSVPSTGA